MAVPGEVDPVDPGGDVGCVPVWPGLKAVTRVVSRVERAGTGVALLAGDPVTTVLPVCVLVCVGVGTAVEVVLEAAEAVPCFSRNDFLIVVRATGPLRAPSTVWILDITPGCSAWSVFLQFCH